MRVHFYDQQQNTFDLFHFRQKTRIKYYILKVLEERQLFNT